jgi:putative ABC transport system permease protein
MAAGRNYSRAFVTDTSNFVINEAVVCAGLEICAGSGGQRIPLWRRTWPHYRRDERFSFRIMHKKIAPIVLALPKPDQNNFYGQLSIKVSATNINSTLQTIETVWKKFVPEIPL